MASLFLNSRRFLDFRKGAGTPCKSLVWNSYKFVTHSGLTGLSARAYRHCMKRSKKEVLDADFAAARAGVLDVAAFLDRVDRGEGEADFRYQALLEVLPLLSVPGPGRARAVLEALSCRDAAIAETAASKAACGAPNPNK
jgi:hypothetical protein